MRRSPRVRTALVGVLLAVLAGFGWRCRPAFMRKTSPVSAVRPQLTASVSRLPLGFELNEGQFDPRVLYAGRAQGGMLFLTRDGLTLSLADIEQESPRPGDPRARLHRRQS